MNDDIFINQNFTRYTINDTDSEVPRCRGSFCTPARNGTDKESYMTHCEKKKDKDITSIINSIT